MRQNPTPVRMPAGCRRQSVRSARPALVHSSSCPGCWRNWPVTAARAAPGRVAPGLFSNPENRIPYEALGELLSTCASLSGRGDLACSPGRASVLPISASLGDLMRNAGTVGELRALILHLHFYDRTAVPVMFRVGPPGCCSVTSPARRHAGCRAVTGRGDHGGLPDDAELCGAGWQPEFVQFSHHRPDSIAGYRRVFGPACVSTPTCPACLFPARRSSTRLPEPTRRFTPCSHTPCAMPKPVG